MDRTRVEENEQMLRSMVEEHKIDALAGIFQCLIDISRSLAVIADNTSHLEEIEHARSMPVYYDDNPHQGGS